MGFSDTDWQLLKLLNEPPRTAIIGFLDRLEQWTDWVERRHPGWIAAALDLEHEFCLSMRRLRQRIERFCLPKVEDLDRFLYLAEHCAGQLLEGTLAEPWQTFRAGILDLEESEDADRFLELMDHLVDFAKPPSASAGGSLEMRAATPDEIADKDRFALRGQLIKPHNAARWESTARRGFSSLEQVQRWWPYFRSHLVGRAFLPLALFHNFVFAIEQEAVRLKCEVLTSRPNKPLDENNPFKNFRHPDNPWPDRIEMSWYVDRTIASLRSSIGGRDHGTTDDDGICDVLMEALLAISDLGSPRQRGTFTHRNNADKIRRVIRELAPQYWYPKIKRIAWAGRIADDPKVQRVSMRKGPKRFGSIKAKSIADYLKKDFDLATGQKLYDERSKS